MLNIPEEAPQRTLCYPISIQLLTFLSSLFFCSFQTNTSWFALTLNVQMMHFKMYAQSKLLSNLNSTFNIYFIDCVLAPTGALIHWRWSILYPQSKLLSLIFIQLLTFLPSLVFCSFQTNSTKGNEWQKGSHYPHQAGFFSSPTQ